MGQVETLNYLGRRGRYITIYGCSDTVGVSSIYVMKLKFPVTVSIILFQNIDISHIKVNLYGFSLNAINKYVRSLTEVLD